MRKLRRILDNVRRILAVEYMVAGRAVDLRAPLRPAAGTAAALGALRAAVAGPGPDRELAPELAAAEELLRSGAVEQALRAAGVSLS